MTRIPSPILRCVVKYTEKKTGFGKVIQKYENAINNARCLQTFFWQVLERASILNLMLYQTFRNLSNNID